MEHNTTGSGVLMSDSRVVVALDFSTAREALELAARLDSSLCRVKVGLELFSAAGPAVVASLRDLGFDVFLDLKLHDIPTTVARACAAAAGLGVWMVNVHTLGGAKMMRAARAAIDEGRHRPLLIGVTLLTSHDDATLAELGIGGTVAAQAPRLAALAHECGLDGVVCSAQEAASLRRRLGAGFMLVTPGIRPEGSETHDQARTLTPRAALAQGADFLVIGRPIARAPDPAAALAAIVRSLSVVPDPAPGRQDRGGPG
jgi:orotidine-5'-phosphate decarboxylase